jgi:dTDP-4-dehydrorhamnose 3,5-epimerase
MIFTETRISGAFLLEIKKIEDDRGFFGRSFCKKELEEHGLNGNIVQANTSMSRKKGTIRGLHYQVEPYHEAKLIRCTRGRVFDVIVDLRPGSPTYLQWFGAELTPDNYRMVYVPGNFAHGYLSLEDNSEVYYNVTEFYTPGSEKGIRYNDPALNIEWPIPVEIVSEKDKSWPDYKV